MSAVRAAVVAALLLVAGLAGCRSSGDDAAVGRGPGEMIRGGTLIAAISSTRGILNPAITTNGTVHGNADLMFNGLLAWGTDGEITGDLAEQYALSADGKQADFTLRPNMTWHDGRPITAQDVDFSFRQVLLRYQTRTASSLGPALGVAGAGNGAVTPRESITMPDGPTGLTVRFSFVTPYFPLLRQLDVTEAAIIPKHVYERCSVAVMGPGATLGNTTGKVCAANNKPVGSGPFKFGTRGPTQIEYRANKAYHKPDLPLLDRVVHLVVDDVADALQANRATSGSVDVGRIPADALGAFPGDPDYSVAQIRRDGGGSNCVPTVGFNLWPKGMTAADIGARPADAPYESPFFADVAVRRALFTAVDRTGMWKEIALEQGQPATSPYASAVPGYQPQVLPGDESAGNDADVAAARAQLDAAGWTDTNGNGARDKGGVELAFDVTHADTGHYLDYGRQFVADLARVGVTVTDRPLTETALQQTLAVRTFDSTIYENCNGDAAVVGIRRQYLSTAIEDRAFANVAGYRRSAMDALWSRAVSTTGQEYDSVNTEIQKLAADDLPYVWILESVTNRVSRSACQGYNDQNTGLYVETAWCR
ncbi:MAG: ABC transporter substrate-binding protein [Acidimicrobiales bacterium]